MRYEHDARVWRFELCKSSLWRFSKKMEICCVARTNIQLWIEIVVKCWQKAQASCLCVRNLASHINHTELYNCEGNSPVTTASTFYTVWRPSVFPLQLHEHIHYTTPRPILECSGIWEATLSERHLEAICHIYGRLEVSIQITIM